ncbi:MAG: TonB-dependent receptor, partial [Chitinophagaceae bacterium]|nr:TonB-dependent receptor [Chitinophagaceae bacterium]
INDSAIHTSVVADKKGAFEIDNLPFAVYKISFSAVGYSTFTLDSIQVRPERYDFNLGDILLHSHANILDEVIVYAEKPLVENKDGKMIFNVGESASSSGSSTAEILKNLPLVNNDPNGKLLLKGKEPKILIDDKPVELNAQQLTDLLESMPGGSIERIEIMVNPPAQYATEEGGVINIVTKKGKIGWTGRANISGGTRGEGNGSVNVAFRDKKISFSALGSINVNRFTGSSHSYRENYYKDSTNYFLTNSNFITRNQRPNLRSQLDYELNKQNSLSFIYQANLNYFKNNTHTVYTNQNRLKESYRLTDRENISSGNGYAQNFTASYLHRGKIPGEIFRAILNLNMGDNNNDKDFHQFFFNNVIIYNDSLQQQLVSSLNTSMSGQLSYDKPFFKNHYTFSTGLYYSRNNYHNTLGSEYLDHADNTWKHNSLLSTDFRFHQDLLTARAGLTIRLDTNWRLIAGVQVESTTFNFNYLAGNTADITHQYWNLLPNITLRRDLGRNSNTSFVYRSSIRRPGIGELNPAIDYSDPYNNRFGNPYLLASQADNFDWNVSLSKGKYYINTSIGFNYVKNVFNTVRTLIDNGKTQVTWQNISNRKQYEASVWGGYTFSKKLRMNTSVGYSYNVYGAQEKQLYKYRDGGNFNTTLNYSYTFSPLLSFDGNARYNSFADPQGRSRSNVNMNFGVQQKLMNKRLIVAFNIIDPFTKQHYSSYTYGSNYYLESESSTNTRNFRLSVSYQLNRNPAPKVKSTIQKKDVLNMLKKGK